MVNDNCLEGVKCPCGNEDAFYIESAAVMYVTDEGAESRGDTSWNDESHTQCTSCERSGKLAEFKSSVAEEQKEISLERTIRPLEHAKDDHEAAAAYWEKRYINLKAKYDAFKSAHP